MPGFFVCSKEMDCELINRYPNRCLSGTINISKGTIKRNTLNKFLNDKAFIDTPELACVTEGIILNLADLMAEYGASDVNGLVQEMYKKEGESFFAKFIGPFSGALYDKKNDLWLVWTNQIGDKTVYYSMHGGELSAGSQFNYLADVFRKSGLTLSFDEQAAYQILTFGFMEGDSTLAGEIKRLRGGQYLRYQNNKVEVKEYFMFHKHPERFEGKTEQQIIDALDEEFRKASALEYAKDEEYGCEHLSDLSGGLDARMNMWVAHTMKPRHFQFITYCKANYKDEIIAKQLAAHWNDEILVKSLDDVTFLYEIDETVFLTGGTQLYSTPTGCKRMLEHIDMSYYGIEHTGQLNGAILGSYYSSIGGGKQPTGMYSEKLKDRLTSTNHSDFDDHELYMLYTRGFRGIMNTSQIRSNYTEAFTTTITPFFLQLCMDIPVELRINHKLYKKWILSKYPEAAKYKWEKTGTYITESELKKKLKRYFIKAPKKLLKMVKGRGKVNTGMNPFDFWFEHNPSLRAYFDKYENEGYKYLPSEVSEHLINDMKELYKTGNVNEKAMVLTVLSAAKLFFGDIKYEFINQ